MLKNGSEPELPPHHRRSIRMKGYDYSEPGAYFTTICTHDDISLFGKIVEGDMQLNEYGKIVQITWEDLVNHVRGIELGQFVIMPNHFHGIIQILDTDPSVRVGPRPTLTLASEQRISLPEIVRQLKTFSARQINQLRGTQGQPVWHRDYYEHIIRNDESLLKIGEYILNNPNQWENDRFFPK